MNIKSLLLGSAAALAAVSGAQAADAIVAAEPEAMEYVRVCDAFGKGYFYIPGTETCLKVGGYVRFQVNLGEDRSGSSDYDAFTRGQLQFDAKNDTEYGTLASTIVLQTNADNAFASNNNGQDASVDNTFLDTASISLAGFTVGYFYNYWDDGIDGETDALATNTLFNSIRYDFDGGAFKGGISVDELEGITTHPNGVGVSGQLLAAVGGLAFVLVGGYDTEVEEGAIRAIMTAEVGPGKFSLAGVYATDPNAYYRESEWSVAAAYTYGINDKFSITPAAQYFSDLNNGRGFGNDDQWRVGLTAGYQITDGLKSLAYVQYRDTDNQDDQVTGFVRLQRDF